MARKAKPRKSKPKKAAKKRPAKKVAAKKPKIKKSSRPKAAAKKMAASGAVAAVKPFVSEEDKRLVREALQECMTIADYADFDWGENPGTMGMETSAWKAILECVCEKIGVTLTPTLVKDTKSYTFSKTVGILAAKKG